MKSLLMFEYFATGEGQTIEFFFDQNMSKEDAMNKWYECHHPYYHVGLKICNIKDVKKDKELMHTIKTHVPSLYDYLMESPSRRPFAFRVDYKAYFNYS